MGRFVCSICSAPGDARAAVDGELEAKVPLREIAEKSGFSRASLSRHHRKCVRLAKLAEAKSWRIGNIEDYQLVPCYPGQTPRPHPYDKRPMIVLDVEVEPAPPPRKLPVPPTEAVQVPPEDL
jgi:hypothetical protein